MENAEEVMQLLEEFTKPKVRQREIPRELDDYLGYVAKTGDPVFQWSLIKNFLREKLLAVVTDFYESTLTDELLPCPNVEPFNYDRIKTNLLLRFDAFSGAPFTIQRICELLINPRKEYNRADKYMRAIEKNILVVSTREPGTGKRPLECDQSETVLNGMPDVKMSESEASLLNVPSDLQPYLGAPPASHDVTIETTEPNSTTVDKIGLGINGEVKLFNTDSEKSCHSHESQSSTVAQGTEQVSSRLEVSRPSEDVPLVVEEKKAEENDCDSKNKFADVSENINPNSSIELDNSIGDTSEIGESTLPDSVDSSDATRECSETLQVSKLESDEVGNVSDENEVSSSPADPPGDIASIQEEINEPTDSEAEATGSCIIQDSETDLNLSPDSDNNSNDRVVLEHETSTISLSEVTATKSDEVDLDCNEISGTVISPVSSGNTSSKQSDGDEDNKVSIELVEECEQLNSHPDSSNDSYVENKSQSGESKKCEVDVRSEADSISEVNLDESSKPSESSDLNVSPDQTEEVIIQEITEELSPSKFSEEDSVEKPDEELPSTSPDTAEEAVVSESSSSTSLKENRPTTVSVPDVQSTSDVVVEMIDNERRDESVIQTIPHIITPDSQDQIAIEEISVDPSCEAEVEAMDVDDCSNQMMVSENEGEPMDEGDQLQS